MFPCNDGTQVKDWKECADATVKPIIGDAYCLALGCPNSPPDPQKGCFDDRDPVEGKCPIPEPKPKPCDPATDPNCNELCPANMGDCVRTCNDGYKLVNGKCEKGNPKDINIIFKTIIKNEETIKKIYNDNLGLNRTIVAINYDEGAAINCVIDAQERGQCETFSVAQDSGKEPLLQIIPFA